MAYLSALKKNTTESAPPHALPLPLQLQRCDASLARAAVHLDALPAHAGLRRQGQAERHSGAHRRREHMDELHRVRRLQHLKQLEDRPKGRHCVLPLRNNGHKTPKSKRD